MTESEDGLVIQKGAPRTLKDLYDRVDKLDLGVEARDSSRFGFRPEVDRSLPVQPVADGEPIVDAARGLRRRRRGEIALNGSINHPEAKELLKAVDARRKRQSHAG
jgi:hypothetical protein